MVKDREAWRAAVRGVAKGQTQLSERTTLYLKIFFCPIFSLSSFRTPVTFLRIHSFFLFSLVIFIFNSCLFLCFCLDNYYLPVLSHWFFSWVVSSLLLNPFSGFFISNIFIFQFLNFCLVLWVSIFSFLIFTHCLVLPLDSLTHFKVLAHLYISANSNFWVMHGSTVINSVFLFHRASNLNCMLSFVDNM